MVYQAIEEYLVRELVFVHLSLPYVVGKGGGRRNQHASSEVDLRALMRNKVAVLRRETGGGCVYQDLNNANYTDDQGVQCHSSRCSPNVG
jgi:hypothetical protein